MPKVCQWCGSNDVMKIRNRGRTSVSEFSWCRACWGEKGRRSQMNILRKRGLSYTTQHGYIYKRSSTEETFQPEHRVVMEQQLGRPLVKGEAVHHINGKRDDNRPENLELWVRTQPPGVRASDLLCPHCQKPYL